MTRFDALNVDVRMLFGGDVRWHPRVPEPNGGDAPPERATASRCLVGGPELPSMASALAADELTDVAASSQNLEATTAPPRRVQRMMKR